MTPPALELVSIDKWFGANHANDAVSLAVPKGSIIGLIGENGAGKTTLMHMVFGYIRPDGGQIRVNGREVAISSPADAIAAGIGMVHQHFMLVDTFTVIENVVLGAERGPLMADTLTAARAELARLSATFGLDVDPDARVGDLPVGAKQKVEILKALYRRAEILILDEPTAVLTPTETEHLFAILRQWRAEGRTVILITHKLKEVLAITDRVVVMRRGAKVAELDTAACDAPLLAEHMVGRPVALSVTKARARPGPPILDLRHVRIVDGEGIVRVADLDLTLRAGEIAGLAGVTGNGQSELVEAIAGLRPIAGGEIRFKDKALGIGGDADAVRARRKAGIAHVPEDRLRMGLIEDLAAQDNAILGRQDESGLNRHGFLRKDAMLAYCRDLMASFDIRPLRPTLAGGRFSGGNQQKIVLGREMENAPDLLIVGQPTRGVDIGAIEFIHKRIVALRDQGAAILLVSAELDEILMLSDRVLVMSQGRIVGEQGADALDERAIGLWMAGDRRAA